MCDTGTKWGKHCHEFIGSLPIEEDKQRLSGALILLKLKIFKFHVSCVIEIIRCSIDSILKLINNSLSLFKGSYGLV